MIKATFKERQYNGRWNPRYLAYCYAHGTPDPDAMLARDEERWPGGKMCGYILWTGARWFEWRASQGLRESDPLTHVDHNHFNMWLFTGVYWNLFPREEPQHDDARPQTSAG